MRKVPGWSRYFLKMAFVARERSKDPRTQVGCIIVDKNQRVIAAGYNGMPAKINETVDLWQPPKKYQYVIHAEANALIHAPREELKNATLYTTHLPCQECAKLIVAAGIKQLYYCYAWECNDSCEVAEEVLDLARVKYYNVRYEEING